MQGLDFRYYLAARAKWQHDLARAERARRYAVVPDRPIAPRVSPIGRSLQRLLDTLRERPSIFQRPNYT